MYHGTSSGKLESIFKEGLVRPYLTSSPELAGYYAQVAAEEHGGEPAILEVRAKKEALLYDSNAMEEPVAFDGLSVEELEALVEKEWEEQARGHPEWCREGYVLIPRERYEISLKVVGSCRCGAIIPPSHIKKY